ncbi:Transmembrane channel-like protein 6 [Tupaia chinensis]|uniref:Transmembrane channel-like protein n=1 Tax=Tupaia chinensis TaxID=246437 RepID=L9L0I0_TUPCH|nr:Transmembrane channel-like protein 6 [Tupaia chinensis]
MAEPLAFVLNVPGSPGDQDQELSPYDESEVHDSFRQLIQEQSLWAEEELELQPREPAARTQGPPGAGLLTVPGPEAAPAYRPAPPRHGHASHLGQHAQPHHRPAVPAGRSRGAVISQYYNRTGGQCTPGAGGLPYNMPLAYLLTVGMAFFVTCIALVYSMSHSFGESYRVGSTSGVHALTVFCSWDYKVTQKWASRLQRDNLRTQLKELLAEWQLQQGPRSAWGRLRQVVVPGAVWLLCLGTSLGCAMAVHAFSEGTMESLVAADQEAALLALPLVVSTINLGAPYLYRGLAALERHDSPGLEVYVSVCRNLILKMVILGVLCYHWLGRRAGPLQGRCWEDFVGQELYRLTVVDLVFALLDTLFGELVWRLISEKKLKRRQKPEFDIARNVLELIYGQTLTWLGIIFCPLLPAVQVLKLLLLFYVKKTSLMANCRAPRRPWRASHMSTVFLTLLCFPSFLGAAVFLCYAVWQVKPSSACGPFRTLDTMYQAGTVWVRHLEEAGPSVAWLSWVHRYLVENTFFIFLASALLLAVIYLNIQVVKGQRQVICLLKEQISNEGEDKIFLINKLHSVYERKEKMERSRVGGTQEASPGAAEFTGGTGTGFPD